MLRIDFTPAGERDLERLDRHLQQRILQKIGLYLSSGKPLSFAKPLINLPPATHRFRIGKYRACFYLQGSRLIIDSIDTREDIYRR